MRTANGSPYVIDGTAFFYVGAGAYDSPSNGGTSRATSPTNRTKIPRLDVGASIARPCVDVWDEGC